MIRVKFLLSIFFVAFFVSSGTAFSASINYSPVAKSVDVDSKFTINVSLSTSDKAVNAFSGTLTFPDEILDAESISTSSSIVNFWTVQPTISANSIRFEGLVLNPGYTGSGGQLFSVTFKAKSRGVAYISLTNASTLANDGLGTNIFSGVIPKTTITIGEGAPISTTPVSTTGVPLAPIVSSSTHPDPSDWYNNKIATINWDIPVGATDVSYSLDSTQVSTPTLSKGLVSSYTSDSLADGEYYFHIRFRNSSGWGAVSHFRIGVDTVAPQAVTVEPVLGYGDGVLHVNISSTDITSGIEKYEISIDGQSPSYWTPETPNEEYISGVISSGRHLLFVRALDFAGNSSANGDYFDLEPVAPPKITKYPQTMENGELLYLEGEALPLSTVHLFFEKKDLTLIEKILLSGQIKRQTESERVPVNSEGKFVFQNNEIWKNGNYHISAKTVLDNGAESLETEFVEVSVLPGKFEKVMNQIKNILLPVIPVLVAIIVIGALLILIRKYFRRYRKSLLEEADQASVATSESIKVIDEEAMNEISLLKKIRQGEPLSEHEQKFLNKLKSDIDVAGNIIQKEINDIEEKI